MEILSNNSRGKAESPIIDFIRRKSSCIIRQTYATVAQLVEHGTHKPGVAGSIPAGGTIRLAPSALAYGPRRFAARAILAQAVSLSIPTLTNPLFFAMS
jgi:hypothetical protein